MPPVDAFLFLITASRAANPIGAGDIRKTRLRATATNSRSSTKEKEEGGWERGPGYREMKVYKHKNIREIGSYSGEECEV